MFLLTHRRWRQVRMIGIPVDMPSVRMKPNDTESTPIYLLPFGKPPKAFTRWINKQTGAGGTLPGNIEITPVSCTGLSHAPDVYVHENTHFPKKNCNRTCRVLVRRPSGPEPPRLMYQGGRGRNWCNLIDVENCVMGYFFFVSVCLFEGFNWGWGAELSFHRTGGVSKKMTRIIYVIINPGVHLAVASDFFRQIIIFYIFVMMGWHLLGVLVTFGGFVTS